MRKQHYMQLSIRKSPYVLIVALLLISRVIYSGNISFEHMGVSQGLKNSRVVSVVQDTMGYMWFATHGGIERFNGKDLVHYDLEDGSEFHSKDNIVYCIENSSSLDLICGTQRGNVYYYDRNNDQFKLLSLANTNSIVSIFSSDNNIWLGTRYGLKIYNIEKDSIYGVIESGFSINVIKDYSENEVIAGTANGIYIIDKNTFQTKTLSHTSDITKELEKGYITSIDHYQGDEFMVSTRKGNVFHISINGNEINHIKNKSFMVNNKVYPIRGVIKSKTCNNYIIAFDGAGLLRVDQNFKLVDSIVSDYDEDNSLSSDGVYKMFYSKENILWVTTYGGGVNYYNPNKQPFYSIQRIKKINNSLRANPVSSIAEDKYGRVWFGTKYGISIQDKNNWKHIPEISGNGEIFQVMDLHATNKYVWAATYGNGLYRVDIETLKITKYSKASKYPNNTFADNLYSVVSDSKGKIWTGGIWGETTVLDIQNALSSRVNISNVTSFYEYNNKMYVGTLSGLFVVDINTLDVERTTNSILNRESIINTNKSPFSNSMYFGTDIDGMIEWDLETDSLRRITIEDGLLSNTIRGMLWDKNNMLWISTTEGLSQYNTQTKKIINYLPIDGNVNIEFNQNAFCALKSGEFLFGGINGVTGFMPDKIKPSLQTARPVLTGVKLSGKKLPLSQEGILNKNIELIEGINLSHDENNINFVFSSIGYTTPEKIQYKWKLDGLDNHWNNIAGAKEAVYTNLPPGKYTFRLKCTNNDLVWQNEEETLDVYIELPWWRKPLAYIMYVLIFTLLIFMVLRVSHTILKEKEYVKKQQFFISVAHDLRTPLSLIKLPVEKMMENKEFEGEYNLPLVKTNIDRLTNLVNQLLDFQKSDLNKVQLQIEKSNIVDFISVSIENFKPLANNKQIEISASFFPENIELYFDKNSMNKVMYNLLSNAIKYTPANGNVSVNIRMKGKKCLIEVSDTGEGIPKNQQSEIFQRYYRATNAINTREVGSGIGLVLTKNLIKLHQGSIYFKSDYGQGSTFTFELPLGKEHFKECDLKIADIISNVKPVVPPKIKIVNDSKEKRYQLLIVEDNPELQNVLTDLFMEEDFDVVSAYDGEEGFQLARKHCPDIIISDVMMSKLNGHQLCLKIRKELSVCHIPIILLTALDSDGYKKEGLDNGADAYMAKPFDMNMLKSQVANLLKNRDLLKKKFLVTSSSNEEKVAPTNKDEKFLHDIKMYVLQNVGDHSLSVESTAKEFGMSRPVLYRKIKALTGLSPQQFVLNVKIKEAARILSEESRNVSETAYIIGFSDPKYFSHIFKKNFGVTPSQFVKQSNSAV